MGDIYRIEAGSAFYLINGAEGQRLHVICSIDTSQSLGSHTFQVCISSLSLSLSVLLILCYVLAVFLHCWWNISIISAFWIRSANFIHSIQCKLIFLLISCAFQLNGETTNLRISFSFPAGFGIGIERDVDKPDERPDRLLIRLSFSEHMV